AERKSGEEEVRTPRGFFARFLQLFKNMVTLKPSRRTDENKSWGEKLEGWVNPVPTAWFQSINALAIFLIAPLFAWLWIALDRRGLQPSIPMKMFLGLVLMSASMAVMTLAARQENRRSSVPWTSASFPPRISVTADHELARVTKSDVKERFHAGRLIFDPQ